MRLMLIMMVMMTTTTTTTNISITITMTIVMVGMEGGRRGRAVAITSSSLLHLCHLGRYNSQKFIIINTLNYPTSTIYILCLTMKDIVEVRGREEGGDEIHPIDM